MQLRYVANLTCSKMFADITANLKKDLYGKQDVYPHLTRTWFRRRLNNFGISRQQLGKTCVAIAKSQYTLVSIDQVDELICSQEVETGISRFSIRSIAAELSVRPPPVRFRLQIGLHWRHILLFLCIGILQQNNPKRIRLIISIVTRGLFVVVCLCVYFLINLLTQATSMQDDPNESVPEKRSVIHRLSLWTLHNIFNFLHFLRSTASSLCSCRIASLQVFVWHTSRSSATSSTS